MIDWVDFSAPLRHDIGEGTPFYNGEVLSVAPDGGLDWGIFKRMDLEGSHSSKIQIRSSSMVDGSQAVRVSGNLVKWFQGHNIYGSADLFGLILEALSRVCEVCKITPTDDELFQWKNGCIELLRVDVTKSVDFGNKQRVLNALRSLDSTANLKYRGRGQFNGHSLLFGKGSRHWSCTLYSKGAEIEKHKLPPSLAETSLPSIADGLLRIEFRLLSMHLKGLGLASLGAWNDNTVDEVHQSHLQQLQISDTTMLDADTLHSLPPKLQLVYQTWKDGHDLRAMFPARTFYNYRKSLLALGIDISVKQERKNSNVVHLPVVLAGQPFVLPEWAMNAPYYFTPRHNAL